MTVTLPHGPRFGTVRAPASKSMAHRLLLCAALGERKATLDCGTLSDDVSATVRCLRALGAGIEESNGVLRVTPIRTIPEETCELDCGESGSTLRFLLPVAAALGVTAVFHRRAALAERPLGPLCDALRTHGMTIREDGVDLFCEGKLLSGDYCVDGSLSSQFVSGLLFALPLLQGDSTLTVDGSPASAPYVAMTERALRSAGIVFDKSGKTYTISGGQRYALPDSRVECDWSGAAAFLCIGAISRKGVTVTGLDRASAQGDRSILDILSRFGADVEAASDRVTVRRGILRGGVIDALDTPDLVPALAALASASDGETRIVNAARLRGKESDRLKTTIAMLGSLGADVRETDDGLVIRGKPILRGGVTDAMNDHRIAMAAAVAACLCQSDVTLSGAECVTKSYPAFWEDWSCLSM